MVGGLSAPSARSSAMPSFMRSAHPFHCPSPTAPASLSGTTLAVKVAGGFCRSNKDCSSKASLPTLHRCWGAAHCPALPCRLAESWQRGASRQAPCFQQTQRSALLN